MVLVCVSSSRTGVPLSSSFLFFRSVLHLFPTPTGLTHHFPYETSAAHLLANDMRQLSTTTRRRMGAGFQRRLWGLYFLYLSSGQQHTRICVHIR